MAQKEWDVMTQIRYVKRIKNITEEQNNEQTPAMDQKDEIMWMPMHPVEDPKKKATEMIYQLLKEIKKQLSDMEQRQDKIERELSEMNEETIIPIEEIKQEIKEIQIAPIEPMTKKDLLPDGQILEW